MGELLVHEKSRNMFYFNPEALKICLDQLAGEHPAIRSHFHTTYCFPCFEDTALSGIVVNNKDGMGVIKVSMFIDASGDGDLCRDAGVPRYAYAAPLPPSSTAVISGFPEAEFSALYRKHHDEFGLEEDWGFGMPLPNDVALSVQAQTHVFGTHCGEAATLTHAKQKEDSRPRRSSALRGLMGASPMFVWFRCVPTSACGKAGITAAFTR